MSKAGDNDVTRNAPIERALQKYSEELSAGRPPSTDEFCACYPHLAPDLRGRIEGFLSTAREAHGSLSPHPAQIGQYKIVSVIGEGGMGVVYLAEQERPFRRKVALKVTKPGVRDPALIRRFHAERQALALMYHPNIAVVHDAGETPDGRPYFVMEHVPGDPITAYCDGNRLSISQRLKLAVQVCRAIHHAHNKGIIHRDLKPSNVLASTMDDGEPIARIIDFGLAKAVGQPLIDDSEQTLPNQILGTPLYMSPEQAGKPGTPVDHHTDIYSLGCLAYLLVSGSGPIEDGMSVSEVIKQARDGVIRKPSAAYEHLMQTDSDRAKKVASDRRTTESELLEILQGDLEPILLKALSSTVSDRYSSMADYAVAIEDYLGCLQNRNDGSTRGGADRPHPVEKTSGAPPGDLQDRTLEPSVPLDGTRFRATILYKRNAQPDEYVMSTLEMGLRSLGHDIFIDRHMAIGIDWAREIQQSNQ